MRTPTVVGNWKMNTTLKEATALANALRRELDRVDGVEVAICPPYVYLLDVADQVRDSRIGLGAQDCHWETRGAFTGEVSPGMLRDVGCAYVVLGHSERRNLMGEKDDLVNRKVRAALAARLTPIVCVGELLEERDRGAAEAVVRGQLEGSLAGLGPAELEDVILAYEPVWAIGTGRTATPGQAQEIHAMIRAWLRKRFGSSGEGVRILYGGSVKPDNMADLMAQADVDGALVGGASLEAASFASIVKYRKENR
ncbi:MAG: triose-phosphate isomerase [Planctomycetes bacterium]|nr:triose-phosphate isomerase [Planctomycetota bacterium]